MVHRKIALHILTVVPGVLISAQGFIVAVYAERAKFYHCSIAE
jgi:hypothetical protein